MPEISSESELAPGQAWLKVDGQGGFFKGDLALLTSRPFETDEPEGVAVSAIMLEDDGHRETCLFTWCLRERRGWRRIA